MADDQNSSSPQREIRVLEIVGCFLAFFAILLLIGVTEGKTVSDRVTNLVSALILLVIGVGMFWRGVVRHGGAWRVPVVLFAVLAVVAAVAAVCITHFVAEDKEEAPAKTEETREEESQPAEEESARSPFVERLKGMGWAMRDVVERISLSWVKVLTVVGFALIAAVVWLVRRETVFEGVADRKWWRDLRLWTLVIMATQVIIYLLLGT